MVAPGPAPDRYLRPAGDVFQLDPATVPAANYATIDGTPIPSEFMVSATITRHDGATRVEAWYTSDTNGWPRLDAVTFHRLPDQDHAQTRTISRPLADRIAAAGLAYLLTGDQANAGAPITYDAGTLAEYEQQIRATLHKATYNGDSSKAWTKERKADVKQIAEKEIAAGRDPDAALMERYGITQSTAATWRKRVGVKKPKRGRPRGSKTRY